MTSIFIEPLSKLTAEKNLAAFIVRARTDLVAYGANLDFESNCWDITAQRLADGDRSAKRGKIRLFFSKKLKDGGEPMSDRVRSFAKAYVRSEMVRLSTAAQRRAVDAFRALDATLDTLGLESVCDCDGTTFDKTVALLLLQVGAATVDTIGPRLGQIARFMDEHGLCRYPLSSWKYQQQRTRTIGRVGKEYEARKRAKMPAPETLDALAQAFLLATKPQDVLTTSVAAILCSAPERINEVMALAEACEIEQTGKDGRQYLGLRWAGSKGYSDHIKLILPGMADVVRTALARIREHTASARHMAKWYEANPGRIYLPPAHEHLREQELLGPADIGPLLGFNQKNGGNTNRWIRQARLPIVPVVLKRGRPATHMVRFADFERHIVSLLPDGFPVADAKTELKFSDALLVMPMGLFFRSGMSLCMFEPLRYHHVSNALGQNASAGSVTVFQRVGLDPDRRLFIKSHQFRHWLNTLAQGASLSQVDIAKWSGRANIHQNSAYDHESSNEIVARIRAAVGDHDRVIGPLAEIPKNLPVSRAKFAEMAVPTAHVTLYGFCIHDFTTTPCEMFRKCLDCREHVCLKGIPGKVERVRQALAAAHHQLDLALAAVADEVYGADDWVETHQATVERLGQLLAILTDPNIADGAVIQLSDSGTYSLSEAAIRDREVLIGQAATLPDRNAPALPHHPSAEAAS